MWLLKQDKTTLQPPWDPKLFRVTKVKETKIYMERDGKPKIRCQDKCKLVKFLRTGDLKPKINEAGDISQPTLTNLKGV